MQEQTNCAADENHSDTDKSTSEIPLVGFLATDTSREKKFESKTYSDNVSYSDNSDNLAEEHRAGLRVSAVGHRNRLRCSH